MPVMSASSIQRRFRGAQEITRSYRGGALIWEKPSVIASFGYITRRTLTGGATSRTFTGVELGTPSPARDVYVGIPVSNSSGAQASAVTVGGVPASLIIKQGTEGGAWNVFTSLWHARVPGGAIGDIEVTHMTNASHTTILVFAGNDAPLAAVGASSTGAGSSTATVNLTSVPGSGKIYAFGSAVSAPSLAWQGADEVFEENPVSTAIVGMAEGTSVAGTNTVRMIRETNGRSSMIAFAAI